MLLSCSSFFDIYKFSYFCLSIFTFTKDKGRSSAKLVDGENVATIKKAKSSRQKSTRQAGSAAGAVFKAITHLRRLAQPKHRLESSPVKTESVQKLNMADGFRRKSPARLAEKKPAMSRWRKAVIVQQVIKKLKVPSVLAAKRKPIIEPLAELSSPFSHTTLSTQNLSLDLNQFSHKRLTTSTTAVRPIQSKKEVKFTSSLPDKVDTVIQPQQKKQSSTLRRVEPIINGFTKSMRQVEDPLGGSFKMTQQAGALSNALSESTEVVRKGGRSLKSSIFPGWFPCFIILFIVVFILFLLAHYLRFIVSSH